MHPTHLKSYPASEMANALGRRGGGECCDMPVLRPAQGGSTDQTASAKFAAVSAMLPDLIHRAKNQLLSGALPLAHWGPNKNRVDFASPDFAGGRVIFMGDIHGDFFALHHLTQQVFSEPDTRLVFLGDLVDRGPHSRECIGLLLELMLSWPERILWIAGNHDLGLEYDPAGGVFLSRVAPSEFTDFLNERDCSVDEQEFRRDLGQLFIGVAGNLPRAILFPAGLLATHGGVPLGDRFESLTSVEALNEPGCLDDFTWTRAVPYPRRIGWKLDVERRQTSSSFEFGYDDLRLFCETTRSFFDVRSVIRGHDHVPLGADIPKSYTSVPLLTLNGFGFDHLGFSPGKYRETLLLGVTQGGGLPRIEEFPVSVEEWTGFYEGIPGK